MTVQSPRTRLSVATSCTHPFNHLCTLHVPCVLKRESSCATGRGFAWKQIHGFALLALVSVVLRFQLGAHPILQASGILALYPISWPIGAHLPGRTALVSMAVVVVVLMRPLGIVPFVSWPIRAHLPGRVALVSIGMAVVAMVPGLLPLGVSHVPFRCTRCSALCAIWRFVELHTAVQPRRPKLSVQVRSTSHTLLVPRPAPPSPVVQAISALHGRQCGCHRGATRLAGAFWAHRLPLMQWHILESSGGGGISGWRCRYLTYHLPSVLRPLVSMRMCTRSSPPLPPASRSGLQAAF